MWVDVNSLNVTTVRILKQLDMARQVINVIIKVYIQIKTRKVFN